MLSTSVAGGRPVGLESLCASACRWKRGNVPDGDGASTKGVRQSRPTGSRLGSSLLFESVDVRVRLCVLPTCRPCALLIPSCSVMSRRAPLILRCHVTAFACNSRVAPRSDVLFDTRIWFLFGLLTLHALALPLTLFSIRSRVRERAHATRSAHLRRPARPPDALRRPPSHPTIPREFISPTCRAVDCR
ncbi:hypothetical protein EXIGLDRAFT_79623 [Exidia glandulosa HHB12029]|uniref:Uncharacterized protein n=1 Tax=Exidia glandulosa HHB12029 TaxID=1314781 RepID=A0A165HMT0_EXIGL|nr:hypothetical protein EXIGLDRAFT_79623 [Exidia glandulosa HHB12029]